MLSFDNILRIFGVFTILLLFIAFNFFIGIVVISMLITPLTYLYSKIVGKSYSQVIDSSNVLYKLNIYGQWALISAIGLVILYFAIYKSF